jgi:hypothetical protein
MMSFISRLFCAIGSIGSALASAALAIPFSESKNKEYVGRRNDELIRTFGINAEITSLSDPNDPTDLEEEWLIRRVISQKELCSAICKRLGCNFGRLRKRVLRQRKNPQNVIRRRSGRPNREERSTSIYFGTNSHETVQWFYQVSCILSRSNSSTIHVP